MKKYAVLSDIHGNSWALKAVLEDIQAKEIRDLINLGDIFYGPLDPAGTAGVLKECRIETVQGNEDRIVYEATARKMKNPTLEYVNSQLSQREIKRLRQLPKTAVVDAEIFCCHGTPESDTEYLLEKVQEDLVILRPEVEIEMLVRGIDSPVIVCGHSHVAKALRLQGGRLIVNAGSVGLPAYSDDSPRFHRMEAGIPHASYVILEKKKTGWDVQTVRVVYDWEKAAKLAEENGRKDWAKWLRTGRG